MVLTRGQFAQLLAPGVRSVVLNWQAQFLNNWEESKKWSPEEMAKQVELYKNVIDTEYGVKLCVKSNISRDMMTMELLVPTRLFADDNGREKLADALQKIAMLVLSMDTPKL